MQYITVPPSLINKSRGQTQQAGRGGVKPEQLHNMQNEPQNFMYVMHQDSAEEAAPFSARRQTQTTDANGNNFFSVNVNMNLNLNLCMPGASVGGDKNQSDAASHVPGPIIRGEEIVRPAERSNQRDQ